MTAQSATTNPLRCDRCRRVITPRRAARSLPDGRTLCVRCTDRLPRYLHRMLTVTPDRSRT